MKETEEKPTSSNSTLANQVPSSTVTHGTIEIPKKWKLDIMEAIEKKQFNLEIRSDIARTLVTLLIAKFRPEPTRPQLQDNLYYSILA